MTEPETGQKTDISHARAVRKKRSEIKAELKAGKTSLKKLFGDKELYKKYIENIKVLEIIGALPGIGRVKAEKILREMEINPCKKVGGLGKNQKEKFHGYFNI